MKTFPKKLKRTDWINKSWINRGNHDVRWSVVTDSGIIISVAPEIIEGMADGEEKVLFASSFYYQFGRPATTYALAEERSADTQSSWGDDRNHGTIKIVRRGYKLHAENIDCLL